VPGPRRGRLSSSSPTWTEIHFRTCDSWILGSHRQPFVIGTSHFCTIPVYPFTLPVAVAILIADAAPGLVINHPAAPSHLPGPS
jgi:hypothetical protein